jgi:hypothetical protein
VCEEVPLKTHSSIASFETHECLQFVPDL